MNALRPPAAISAKHEDVSSFPSELGHELSLRASIAFTKRMQGIDLAPVVRCPFGKSAMV